jgi:hypothetical protein
MLRPAAVSVFPMHDMHLSPAVPDILDKIVQSSSLIWCDTESCIHSRGHLARHYENEGATRKIVRQVSRIKRKEETCPIGRQAGRQTKGG